MERWTIEYEGFQLVLTHHCDSSRPTDTSEILRQDIGGGYIRCERCGEKFLPSAEPGNPRLLFRLRQETEPALDPLHAF